MIFSQFKGFKIKNKSLQTIYNKLRKFFSQQSGKILYIALGAAIIYNILFPATIGYADEVKAEEITEVSQEFYGLPEIGDRAPRETKNVRITGYSSTPDQCSGDPFITASGARVHEGTVATNCLPFGSKIKFPELFGDQVFTVEDRMSSRYGCEAFDIWMPDRGSALTLGKQYTTVEIL